MKQAQGDNEFLCQLTKVTEFYEEISSKYNILFGTSKGGKMLVKCAWWLACGLKECAVVLGFPAVSKNSLPSRRADQLLGSSSLLSNGYPSLLPLQYGCSTAKLVPKFKKFVEFYLHFPIPVRRSLLKHRDRFALRFNRGMKENVKMDWWNQLALDSVRQQTFVCLP